jgi:type II secretory pathway component PulF
VKPLPYAVRAELFLQLARLEAAGLPYERAMATIALPTPEAKRRLKAMQALASRGLDAAKAGAQSGLFTSLEARMVRAALIAGSPAPTYQRLAESYSQRARQWSAMRSRLMLPALVLAIALFVQPLPALVGGAIGVKGYAWQVLWPVLLIAALVAVLRMLWMRGGEAKGKSFHQRIPIYGPIFVRTNLRDFFESLALLLEAGAPMLEALVPAIETDRAAADLRRRHGGRALPAGVARPPLWPDRRAGRKAAGNADAPRRDGIGRDRAFLGSARGLASARRLRAGRHQGRDRHLLLGRLRSAGPAGPLATCRLFPST